jgi:hypothetical protein
MVIFEKKAQKTMIWLGSNLFIAYHFRMAMNIDGTSLAMRNVLFFRISNSV